jgi:lysophospholipase L1-like esterase
MLRRKPDAVRAVAGGLALALALSLASCSSSGSSAPEDVDPDFGANDPDVVVALGDSITFGLYDKGVDSCDESERGDGGYPARLQGLVSKSVVNAGVCGENSREGASRVASVLKSYRPGVLLIDYSPNDLYLGTDALISNLRTMITAARNNGTVPILGTMVPARGEHRGWEPFIRSANAKILDLCFEQNIECADLFEAFANDPGFLESPYALLSSDGLHPNAAGYELMARTWRWPLVRVF